MTTAMTERATTSGDDRQLPGETKGRLRKIQACLTARLVEREIPVRLTLLAAIAGEHLLLIGPPGTAKSELARRLRLAFCEQTYFERLLTRFSVPEELFGPLSIKMLEQDKYVRQTDGYLPTAAVAFLDEIFKANSAILNALLTLLNEREFDNGTERVKTPLISVIGASNELPQEEELLALYDRFLLRYHVGPVTPAGFDRLLDLRGDSGVTVDESLLLGPQDLAEIRKSALAVRVPPNVLSLMRALRFYCSEQGIPVSDRRWRKALFLLQVSACTDGREEVSIWDCWLLQHCLWHQPDQAAKLGAWYDERAGAASPREPDRFNRLAAAWEQRLKEDQSKTLHRCNSKGQPLYRTGSGETTTESATSGYHSEKNKPILEAISYSEAHVEGRAGGVAAVGEEVAAFIESAKCELDSLDEVIRGHLWVDSALAVSASRRLEEHVRQANELRKRFAEAEKGFRKLPLEEESDRSIDEPAQQWCVGDHVVFRDDDGYEQTGVVQKVTEVSVTVSSDDHNWCPSVEPNQVLRFVGEDD
jgi:MoxR-like ATPase